MIVSHQQWQHIMPYTLHIIVASFSLAPAIVSSRPTAILFCIVKTKHPFKTKSRVYF